MTENEKVLITSALPYANGPLHFGHIAGAYLPGDCYARFQRMRGKDVLYICGSDEYGIAITMSAEMAGRTPQEHVDIFHKVNKQLFEQLNFSFDHFSRTSWQGHVGPVHQFFNDLLENGFIEERVTDQLYSEADGKFLADRYVVGTCPRCGFSPARGDECPECGASYDATDLKEPRSKLTGAKLVHKPTKHWFLLLEKFKDKLTSWLATKQWKPNVVNFIKGYIDELHARSITRDLKWGIPVPVTGADGKVLYVWFDAPIGYISATMEWAQKVGNPERWKSYWCDPNTRLVQFIGKDNLPFHAVIFPAMVMGQNQPFKLVDELPANEFLRLEGRQFSKSDGWYIDFDDFFQRYTTDQIRYVLAANAPEAADAEFTWREFQVRCNSELVGKFGNLVNRVLVFAQNRCDGKVPAMGPISDIDRDFLADIKQLVDRASECYESFRVRQACQVIMELAQRGNVYFDAKKPWVDAKSAEGRPAMATTIACCLVGIQALALVSYPIMPGTADKIWHLLGQDKALASIGWSEEVLAPLPAERPLPSPEVLFRTIEDEQIAAEVAKLHRISSVVAAPAPKRVESPALKSSISIEEVQKLDLRVGEILKAEPVPKSDKLLKLQVDIGLEQRTVVAGIGKSYKPDDLIGRKVLVVANLKPATLMGVESQGMLLAGKSGQVLELAGIQSLPNGSVVS